MRLLRPTVLSLLALAAPLQALAEGAAICPSLTLSHHIADGASRARLAFAQTRLEEFQEATRALGDLVPCLMEPIDPAVAAEVHRMIGLGAFVARDTDRAQQAFAAARSTEPAYAWPEELVPWGHPILGVYQALPVEAGRFATVAAPPAGWVYLDGRPGEPRPLDWPVILQVSDAEGAIQLTAYLWPGQAPPSYAVATAPSVPVPAPVAALMPGDPRAGEPRAGEPIPGEPLPGEPRAGELVPVVVPATSTVVRRGPRGWALATAGGAAAAAGVLYFFADRSADAYWDPATATGDLEPLRRRTNGLVLASAGAGVVAIGTGTLAFLSVRW